MVIDTHCHLSDSIYTDLNQLIANMPSDNLEKIVCASAGFEDSKMSVKIANEYKSIYAMIGIHPENAPKFNEQVKNYLIETASNKKVVAIGEIGLDYHYDNTDKQLQKQVFVEQLKIAHQTGLPIVIHVRDAYKDLLDILIENKNLITNGGIIHCFSGSLEFAKECIKLGFYIAFGGVLTFKNAKKAVEVASSIELEKVVVETDAPWLCPEPHRGERNEPKYVNYIVQKLAEIRKMSRNDVEQVLLENTYRIFKKLER